MKLCKFRLLGNFSQDYVQFVQQDVEMFPVESERGSEPDGGVAAHAEVHAVAPHQTHDPLPPVRSVAVHGAEGAAAPHRAPDARVPRRELLQAGQHLRAHLRDAGEQLVPHDSVQHRLQQHELAGLPHPRVEHSAN